MWNMFSNLAKTWDRYARSIRYKNTQHWLTVRHQMMRQSYNSIILRTSVCMDIGICARGICDVVLNLDTNSVLPWPPL